MDINEQMDNLNATVNTNSNTNTNSNNNSNQRNYKEAQGYINGSIKAPLNGNLVTLVALGTTRLFLSNPKHKILLTLAKSHFEATGEDLPLVSGSDNVVLSVHVANTEDTDLSDKFDLSALLGNDNPLAGL